MSLALPRLTNWIGFGNLFDEIDRMIASDLSPAKIQGFPPYNVKKLDETSFTIEVALAGFSREDIEITQSGNQLYIKGATKSETPDTQFIWKGIAERSFSRSFTIAENVIVKSADLLNGLLVVQLERQIPEEQKLRKIEIGALTAPKSKQLLTE